MPRHRRTNRQLHFARQLRREMTVPEQRLWRALRDRRLAGLEFRRQVPVVSFIADFACVGARLIVEIDGDSHADRAAADQLRTARLSAAGWKIIRVANDDVLENLEGVLMRIVAEAGLDPGAWRDGAEGQLPEGAS
ncbi:MAG: endonuclease domain-containing protein [Planctomycetaceae bacterium]|nr:endonuclease domain-containing protein [Planctomycetaceae bacterium]